MNKIAIIGNGTHSKRIQKILKKQSLKYFIFKPVGSKIEDSNNYKILESCENFRVM